MVSSIPDAYSTILNNSVLPMLWQFYVLDPCYFQDDNSRPHVVTSTMDWYSYDGVNRLDWFQEPRPEPNQKPLRQIESLNQELWQSSKISEGTWMSSPSQMEKNTTSCYKQLVESMFRRILADIASYGGSNNYWVWINVVYLFNHRCPCTYW